MFIKLNFPPNKIDYVACSGGIDSMVLVDFLLNARHKFDLIFVNHRTINSSNALVFLEDFCSNNNLCLNVFNISKNMPKGVSKEAWWREERYNIFHNINGFVATGHQLNDVAETWLFSSFNGNSKLIPEVNKNVVRPLLKTSRNVILKYSIKNNVKYFEDESNFDCSFNRNRIRHKILPEVLKVNPGFLNMLRKKYNRACSSVG